MSLPPGAAADTVKKSSPSLSQKVSCTMNMVIVIASIAVAGAALAVLALWYRRGQPSDLGSVSHTWVAELRAGDPYDSSR